MPARDFTVRYEDHAPYRRHRVFFEGTGALIEGSLVCYQRTKTGSGTGEAATDPWQRRDIIVNVPSATNADAVAGVTAQAYAANAEGQWIEIWEPGSVCRIYCNQAVTIGDFVTGRAGGSDVGQFSEVGDLGRGSARILETEAEANHKVLAELLDGPESGLVQIITPAVGGGAQACTPTGHTRFQAAALTGDATLALAQGSHCGQKKTFEVDGDLGDSKDLIITPATAGIQADDSTAFVSWTADDDGDSLTIVFERSQWKVVHHQGGGSIASS